MPEGIFADKHAADALVRARRFRSSSRRVLLETERLLELGEAAEGKDTLEAQVLLNHKAAIELLVDQADEIGFGRPQAVARDAPTSLA